ncbi:MAG TPA: four helix bundle protein [Gemmatimonadales bacterium]|nr:four helix bundle protein [Gemmatimonadales bacterium]
MRKYRSLIAWQRAHQLVLLTHKTADAVSHPRSYALLDQLRRAAISVEANIVEGYALSTRPQFLRHLRIALGSAAETECLIETAAELDYLPADAVAGMRDLIDQTLATLFGLLRRH